MYQGSVYRALSHDVDQGGRIKLLGTLRNHDDEGNGHVKK